MEENSTNHAHFLTPPAIKQRFKKYSVHVNLSHFKAPPGLLSLSTHALDSGFVSECGNAPSALSSRITVLLTKGPTMWQQGLTGAC